MTTSQREYLNVTIYCSGGPITGLMTKTAVAELTADLADPSRTTGVYGFLKQAAGVEMTLTLRLAQISGVQSYEWIPPGKPYQVKG